MSIHCESRLERPRERMLAGVCHGLGDYFSVDPVLVRLAFVALTAAGGAGIFVYLVLWVIMPNAGEPAPTGPGTFGEGIRTMASEMRDAGREVRSSFEAGEPPAEGTVPAGAERHHHGNGGVFLGVGFVILGVWLLLGNLGLLDWASARYVWPVFLIVIGFAMLARRLR